MLTRRDFGLTMTSAAFAGLALSGCGGRLRYIFPGFGTGPMTTAPGYGALVPDPHAAQPLVDLPHGFEYRIISQAGDDIPDSGGLVVPDNFDGMGAFELDAHRTVLVRNHELKAADGASGAFVNGVPAGQKFFCSGGDGKPLPGGTTTLVYNCQTGEVEQEYLSLAGTLRNCAGGVTPWGSWLTCEEVKDNVAGHGWVFEVPADPEGPVEPVPLTGLGRFRHEAAAVQPRTGIVYLTEDQHDGLFYRFVPEHPNDLKGRGRFQALGFLDDFPNDSRNWGARDIAPGPENARRVRWITLSDPENPGADLRKRGARAGAVRFGGGEGIYFGVDEAGAHEIFFCCTIGGPRSNGQIMRYRPSPDEGECGSRELANPGCLELFLESTDPWTFKHGDNLTMAPNGDLVVCEESYVQIGGKREYSHLRGVTPEGAVYDIARARTPSEFAGICFSPDGETMFVNVYGPGRTLAVTGNWKPRRAGWQVPCAGRFPGRPDPALGGRCGA